jgi:hypothetical protein
MQVLADWAEASPDLKIWLKPRLERLRGDHRKSIANRAAKLLARYD